MIDSSLHTAVFHSISELSKYMVEIHYLGNSFFISLDDQPICFDSLELAKKSARNAGATAGFLALSKVYEEVDFMNDYEPKSIESSHDLMPISLL